LEYRFREPAGSSSRRFEMAHVGIDCHEVAQRLQWNRYEHDERERSRSAAQRKEPDMLYTIAVILIILWLLGFISGVGMGAFIHILLVVAVILILVSLISGNNKV
jgi:Flp pilus assembly protein TadB